MRLTCSMLFLLTLSFGCKTNSGISSTSTDSDNEFQEQILFLNFRIEKDSAEVVNIHLMESTWILGSFKEIIYPIRLEAGVLEFQFLDTDQTVLSKLLITNPLQSSVELFSPDGNIERKTINLKHTEFMLRANLSKKASFVKVNDENGMITLIQLL